jgi:hypothetical protein
MLSVQYCCKFIVDKIRYLLFYTDYSLWIPM